MRHPNLEARIRASAALAALGSAAKDETAPVGFLCGAAYALLRAEELGFAHGEVEDTAYATELRDVARVISAGVSPTAVVGERHSARMAGAWLAGFYFDTALHRIAAVAERLEATQYGTAAWDTPMPLGLLKYDANSQKHERGGVLERGRWARTLEDAVAALENVVLHARQTGVLSGAVASSSG